SKELSRAAAGGWEAARGLTQAESSIRTLGTSLSNVKSGAGDAVSGLSEVRDVSQQVAGALEDLSGRKIGIEFDVSSAIEARDAMDSLDERLDSLQGRKIPVDTKGLEEFNKKVKWARENAERITSSVKTSAPTSPPPIPKAVPSTPSSDSKAGGEKLAQAIKDQEKAVKKLDKSKQKLSKSQRASLAEGRAWLEQLKEVQELLRSSKLDDEAKDLIKVRIAAESLAAGMSQAAGAVDGFGQRLMAVNDEAMEGEAFSALTVKVKSYQS
ncbi:unnamed protein product, partial [marine sediment metagenome]